MKMKMALTTLAAIVLVIPAFAADSTESIIQKAQAQAQEQKKNILVKFSASWCTWCHRMDDWLKKTEAGQMVANQYIIVTLIVDEAEDKKALENPGANDFKSKLGGNQQGIPFFAIIDPSGKTLQTSLRPSDDPTKKPSNIGFPVEDFEIAHFMKMVKTTSKLTIPELAKAEISLKENAKKIKGGS